MNHLSFQSVTNCVSLQPKILMMNTVLLSFLNLGGYEVLLIFLVVLLLFGGRKIPELARGVGKGIREFNNARASIESEIKQGMKDSERKPVVEEKKPE